MIYTLFLAVSPIDQPDSSHAFLITSFFFRHSSITVLGTVFSGQEIHEVHRFGILIALPLSDRLNLFLRMPSQEIKDHIQRLMWFLEKETVPHVMPHDQLSVWYS